MRMRIVSSSSKPISSPGRTESFPPLLMRFLRSDKSSRSRGRSKTTTKNPLFFRKKKSINSSTNSIETTQEPSSPKVTCIGQVRVRRSKHKSGTGKNLKKPLNPRKYTNYNLCCWSRKPNWKWKWLWSWILLDCCSASVRTASARNHNNNNGGFGSFDEEKKRRQEGEIVKRRFEMRRFDDDDDDDDDVFERGRRSSASEMRTVSTITPPKNALFLTRSRSASLASRFWDEEETGEFGEAEEVIGNGDLCETRRSSASEMGTISTARMPPKNALVLTRSASLAQRFWGEESRNARGIMRHLDEEDLCETGRSSASEIGTTATVKNGLPLKRCTSSLVKRFWGDERRITRRMKDLDEEDLCETTGRRSSASEMGTTATVKAQPQNALLLTRSKSSSLASRWFWGEEGEESRNASRMRDLDDGDDLCETGRRSSLSEIGTDKSPPKNALLLTRSRSSSLANRFRGEELAVMRPMRRFEEEDLCETGRTSSASEIGTSKAKAPPKKALLALAYRFRGEGGESRMRHYEEEDLCDAGRRISASEIGTTATSKAPPKDALLLMRSRSSTLASRFRAENEEETKNKGFENEGMSINNRDSSVESKGNRGSKFSEDECGELNLTAVKDEECKYEDGNLRGVEFNKLRRCKSEPASSDLENFDPQNSEFWRLQRSSDIN